MPPPDWTDPQNIIAIATAAIACFGLFISCISVYVSRKTLDEQKEHDQLSVRPIGAFAICQLDQKFAVTLENCGVGPLIIESIEVDLYDEKGPKAWPFDLLGKGNHLDLEIRWGLKDYAVIAGKSFDLLLCKIDPEIQKIIDEMHANEGKPIDLNKINPKIKEKIREINAIKEGLNKIRQIRVNYTDIYGKTPFWTTEQKIRKGHWKLLLTQ